MTKTCPDCQATVLSTSQPIKEATAAQHFDLRKGEPARFVRNGILETCQCTDCAALAATPAVDATQGALALYLNEVQPVDGRVQINVSIDELTVLRHLAGAAPAVGGEIAAWRVEWIDGMLSFSVSEPWNDPSTIKSITPLYAAPPASPLRGRLNRECLETLNATDDGDPAGNLANVLKRGFAAMKWAQPSLAADALIDALSASPEQPAAYPSAEADEAHADLLRRLAAVPKEEKE